MIESALIWRGAVARLGIDRWAAALVLAGALLGSGCSIRQMAVNKVGDALAGGGTTFSSDNDPELIRQAVPFSLKLVESLLAETPRHEGLLLAAAKGFTQYSFAFVQMDADFTEEKDLGAAIAMRERAKRLYARARDYGLRGLEARHPGFRKALTADPERAVRGLRRADVPALYWTAVSWAATIGLSKDDPDSIADLSTVEALVDRAVALQDDFDNGGLETFLITFEGARQGRPGDPAPRIRAHYERALGLSQGTLAGPYVSYAEAASVKSQNLAEFETLLEKALAVDVDAKPEYRLENLIMQRRARWLLDHKDQYFLIPEKPEVESSEEQR